MICTCCYKCEKRCVNCHSTCKEYLEFVKQNEIDKKKKMQEKIIMYYAYENKEKIDKELRRRGIIKWSRVLFTTQKMKLSNYYA